MTTFGARSVAALLCALTALTALVVVAEPAAAAHAVTSVAPNALGQNAGAQTLVITGTGFSSLGGAPAVTVSGTGVTVQSTTLDSPTQLTAQITVAPGATVGARTVTVSQGVAGLDADDCVGCLTINAGPSISSFGPPGGSNTGVPPVLATLTVAGTGFQPGASLRLRRPEFDDIVASTPTVNPGGTSISGTVDLTGQAGARWIVVVINPDGGTSTFGNGTSTGFLISGSTPTVTSVSPATRGAGSTDGVVTLTGTNFARGATISFGAGVTVTDSTWLSLTSYQAVIDVGAGTGAKDVVLTNFDSQASAPCSCFSVTAAPSVTSIVPASRGQGAANQSLVITGTGFVGTPTVTVSGLGVTVHSVTFDGPTQLTVSASVAETASTGVRTLTVTNPDGGSDTIDFTINPQPTVTNVTPASRGQNAVDQDIVVTGTAFVATPQVLIAGTGVTVNTVTFDGATQLTVNVTVAPTTTVGPRDLTVINPDAGRKTAVGAFTVNAGPTVSDVAPDALARGVEAATVVVTGAGFVATPQVEFSGTGVTVDLVTQDSASQLTLDVSVAADAPLTARDMTVTNPDAGTITIDDAITINPAPTVTAADPAALGQAATADVEVTGTAFQDGATVSFGADVTVNDVTFVSSTELIADVSVDAAATPGARTVTVTNPDFGEATCSCFAVAAGPAITSISPAAGANTGDVSITNLAGSGFAADVAVQLEREGFDPIPLANPVVSNGGTKITGTFDLTPTGQAPAAPGLWTVRVTNPDAGTDTLPDGFTVTSPAPTVGDVVPSSTPQGSTPTVTVDGTGFADGATVSVSGTGVTVGETTVLSATQIEVELAVAADAATGARDVTVTNADTQAASCTGCFAVDAKPTLSTVAPSSRGQGAANQNLVLTGTGFVATPTVGFSGTGIAVNDVTRDSATQLTVNVTVAPSATPGARDVTVTNPDDGTVTATGAFTVNAMPTATSANPSQLGQGAVGPVVVQGTGFVATPTVSVSGTGVTVNTVTRDSATQLTVTVTVAQNAPAGARNVTVTNPDGGSSTANGLLTITAAGTTQLGGWGSLEGAIVGSPAIVSTAPNTARVFARGLDNAIWTRTLANGTWSPWTSLGGVALSAPGAAARGSLAEVLVRGSDGAIWRNTCAATCTGWSTLGGGTDQAPAVVSRAANQLDVFIRGLDGQLWYRGSADGVTFTAWTPLGGVLSSAPAATSRGANILDVAVRGGDGRGYLNTFAAGGASGWTLIGGPIVDQPALVARPSGVLDLYARSTTNGLLHAQRSTAGTWGALSPLPGTITAGPAATAFRSSPFVQQLLAVRGSDGALWVSLAAVN